MVNSCDTIVDSESTSKSQIETIHLDIGEGEHFTVHLSEDIFPKTYFFDDMDHLYHFMDSIEASGQVTLNTNLYSRLSHALYPDEIAVLDTNGITFVGKYKYMITPDAVTKTNLDNNGENFQVETYHGESGDVYLEEFAILANNLLHLDQLEGFIFKDPEIHSLYINLKNQSSAKTLNPDRKHYGPVGTVHFPFDDPTFGGLGIVNNHERGYIFWNQSVGYFRRRAIAHTGLLFRPINTSLWYGYRYLNYAKHLHTYNSSNFVIATVDGGKGRETCTGKFECKVYAKRKSRRDAVSWHSAGFSPCVASNTPERSVPA